MPKEMDQMMRDMLARIPTTSSEASTLPRSLLLCCLLRFLRTSPYSSSKRAG